MTLEEEQCRPNIDFQGISAGILQVVETEIKKLKENARLESDEIIEEAKEESRKIVEQSKQEAKLESERIVAQVIEESTKAVSDMEERMLQLLNPATSTANLTEK